MVPWLQPPGGMIVLFTAIQHKFSINWPILADQFQEPFCKPKLTYVESRSWRSRSAVPQVCSASRRAVLPMTWKSVEDQKPEPQSTGQVEEPLHAYLEQAHKCFVQCNIVVCLRFLATSVTRSAPHHNRYDALAWLAIHLPTGCLGIAGVNYLTFRYDRPCNMRDY